MTRNLQSLPNAPAQSSGASAEKRARPMRLLRDGAIGLWLVMGLSIVLNVLVLTSPVYTLQIFDRVLPTRNVDTLLYLTLIAFFAVAILGAFDGLRQSALANIAYWWAETNRPLAFEATLGATRDGVEATSDPFADIVTVRTFLSGQGVVPLFDAPWVPFFVAAIWLLHPLLGMLALGSALVLFLLAVVTDLAGRRPTQEAASRQGQLDRAAGQYLRGADPIAAMGMQNTLSARQRVLHAEQTGFLGKAVTSGAVISGISKAVRIAVQMAVMGLGALLVVQNELSSGGMIAASIILGRALAPIEQMIGTWRTFIVARDANRRVAGLLSAKDARADAVLLPAPRGQLTAIGLRYVPKGLGRALVDGISLQLEPGTVTALLGASGSGKTTLCRLLVGAVTPTSGIVRIDGADLRDWRPDQIGPAIGYVSQGFELFAGTVRDNVARFREDTADEEVVAAATLAGCHELILGLPLGYASLVGEGGRFLSAGQRQRVSLARALFRSPKLIVLDEANAFLDSDGEAALARTVVTLKQLGCSVLLVTHRPALLGAVDKIGLMREGHLDALDNRDVILGKLGVARGPAAAPTGPGQAEHGAVT